MAKYTTIGATRETIERLKELAPDGNVSRFIRDIALKGVTPESSVSQDIDVKINALKAYSERGFKNLEEKLEAIAIMHKLYSLKLEVINIYLNMSDLPGKFKKLENKYPSVKDHVDKLYEELGKWQSLYDDIVKKNDDTDTYSPMFTNKYVDF